MTDLDQSPLLQRLSRNAAGFLIGGLIGLVVTIVLWRTLAGEPAIPEMTHSDWEQAVDHWHAANVLNYELEVMVTGRQPATYAVEVRDGQVVAAMREGKPLPQKRTWTTWTVDGMFETIARDLDSVAQHASGRASSATPQLQLRAAFHPELGYPQRYLRTEMVRFGSNPEVSWSVTKFARTQAETARPAADSMANPQP